MFFHTIELGWIQALQDLLRGPILDPIFMTWNYVDTLYFTLALTVTTWLFVDRRVGIRLFYLFVLSSILNTVLKRYLQLPRPCQIDPLVGLLSFSTPGFPSGASQTAAIVAGVIWIESKKNL